MTANTLASLPSHRGHGTGWLLNRAPHNSELPWLDWGKERRNREREMRGALSARSQPKVLTGITAPGGGALGYGELGCTTTTTTFGLGPAHGKRAQSSEGKRGRMGGESDGSCSPASFGSWPDSELRREMA
jgi:hypothetical protein